MPSLSVARAANASFSPSYYRPVALFVGGTAGISKGLAQAFARHTKGNAHIVLVGRNASAASDVLASFPKPPDVTHEFVACDSSLMKNVDALTSSLLARLPKLNFLVMSPGIFNLNGRDETEEGIDRRLALEYYARWKFTHDLLPLLQKASDAGEDTKVMSILAAGSGQPVDLDDLGLKKTYGIVKAAQTSPTYTDAMIQTFAEQHPDMSFIHVHPGLVRTQIVQKSHWIGRALSPAMLVLLYPFSISEQESGEHLFYGMVHSGKGVNRLNGKGDDIGDMGLQTESVETRRRIWEHTRETVEQAVISTKS